VHEGSSGAGDPRNRRADFPRADGPIQSALVNEG